ncbi:putative hydroxymethylpyrimidine transport system substrate-binding protein [Aureimonas phyllosphaerae]|uniref:Putative hydroxymethylpyrimidine transport system substrate-binding protein n=1 Tax=Aureimonas phyllosphaerae TaxID=1166078 RepID=A0A7W6BW54_9HYPH|nr:ABC transporter substrate-binding protein [Aureimonas phyllosphaerae]MBB3933897.1 putative hydroxymethylpyrimidine transport system substrate-binding protein [Aureimonas phyllosphaerae]MBB3958887.1 putative hydroxymethylpyrimidine transport system substrate-binding protein [Aureimonas phyllosphaerae]SFF20663.1 putative hydroxymethylpyrimidine transport system substrate-binding protein [Aureimonas phyllosphaerae]
MILRPLLAAIGFALAALGPAPALAADKLTVLLEWFVNPDHVPLVVAREKGFFAARGLDVDLVPPADPSAPPRLLAAGEADVAVHYQPNLMLDVKAGLPLVRFGTLVETPLNTVMVRADGPVKTLADLKGRKIGYSVAGIEEAVLSAMLGSVGLSLSDVELVNVNFALTPSLLSGNVDATIGAYRNFELTQIRLEGHEGQAFFPEENGVPAYDELILVTSREKLGDPRLPRFLAAVEEAAIFATNHPDEALALFLKAYPDLDDELNRRAFADTLPRFAKRPFALDAGRYARFATFMKDKGLLDAAPPLADYAVELTP